MNKKTNLFCTLLIIIIHSHMYSMVRHSHTISQPLMRDNKNWRFFYCVLNKDLSDYIKLLFHRLIEKENFDLKKLGIAISLKTESRNNIIISPDNILKYRKIFDKEIVEKKIDEFTISATITTSDASCCHPGKRDYNLNVYDKDDRCIIKHTCKAPISFVEIHNNVLMVYYKKPLFSNDITRIDSWNLDWNKKKEEILKSANCLEFALIYQCAKEKITEKDLNSPLIKNIFNKFASSQNTLPAPQD